ncbi:ATPase associated with various cellular activities AAA_3 [Ignisphaera aggregans DSM 17230]|uniref:ATPase associated with various cellular activities AAA_3 n=1 Tax=Ignisphaera aggregans (strain DSM 17230 / JCM 13409 / AQ1.S1) TaxID=583356 RepID=E0SQV6_IGNAA|nr:ATPase associated with various cellular activities AAA_3 [Ignisphaera aggregans DSM 17230]
MYTTKLGSIVSKVVEEASKILVSRETHVMLLLLSMIAEGHVLIEGVPGIAKTLTAKVIAKLTNLSFSRIQCTLDILPADVIGTKIYNQKLGDFEIKLGPIYANIVLVDEINRASPRTQSALLEAMQERQITIEGETIKLPRPFIVIATQNPIEMEGVFPLPEAQLDRFFIKLEMTQLDRDSLIILLKKGDRAINKEFENLKPIINADDIISSSNEIDEVYFDDSILEYIVRIIEYTHKHPATKLGVSPRGALHLFTLSKEFALADNRKYLIPDDIKNAAIYALPHRIFIKPEYIAEGYTGRRVVNDILSKVEVPRP